MFFPNDYTFMVASGKDLILFLSILCCRIIIEKLKYTEQDERKMA